MPWKETSTMDQRILFIADYLSGDSTKKALCMSYALASQRCRTPAAVDCFDLPDGFS